MPDAPKKDYNDPQSHGYLADLLESPGKLGLADHVVKSFSAGLDGLLELPVGEGRKAALFAFNSGVSAAIRRAELYGENVRLKEQLKLERPELSELNELARQARGQMATVERKFREAAKLEEAKGVDIWKTSWCWFEHELAVSANYVNHIFGRFESSLASPAAPDSPSDAPAS